MTEPQHSPTGTATHTGVDRGHDSDETRGQVDLVSVLYVIGGVPAMVAFFIVLFLLVGSCDEVNITIPA